MNDTDDLAVTRLQSRLQAISAWNAHARAVFSRRVPPAVVAEEVVRLCGSGVREPLLVP